MTALGRLLVLVDRPALRTVIPTVGRLARLSGSRIRLLSLAARSARIMLDGPPEVSLRAAERILRADLGDDHEVVTSTLRVGEPEEQLLTEIEAWSPDLVVIGQRRRLRLGAGLLEAAVARAHRPVLLLPSARRAGSPSENPLAVRRIVVALDGGGLAELGVMPAVELGRLLQTPIDLVRILEPARPFADDRNVDPAAESYLRSLAGRVANSGVEVTWELIEDDEVVRGLRSAAGRNLIVVASHARRGIMRVLLGSTAAGVTEHAIGPVLVVPPDSTRSTTRHQNATGDLLHG